MKKELKKVTDLTIDHLLINDVILPSTYFEEFSKNAKTLDLDLESPDFGDNINKLLTDEFNSIENYMDTILKSSEIIEKATNDSKDAILRKDTDLLTNIYKDMKSLQKEVKSLKNKLFVDDLTNTHNRKWIYNKFLSKSSFFRSNGVAVIIKVPDYAYIQEKYGQLISDNLLIFISNFFKNKLKEEKINFDIARFYDNNFFIFIENEKEQNLNSIIFNIQQSLCNTTLKSNSGILIKAICKSNSTSYIKGQESKDIFDSLINQISDK